MDQDQRTLEQLRRRLAAIESQIPDPALPGPARFEAALAEQARRRARRDVARLNVYGLLALVLAVLVVVALPYAIERQQRPALLPGLPPAGGPAASPSARPTAPATAPPARAELRATPGATRAPMLPCSLTPALYEGAGTVDEKWAIGEWALVEGQIIERDGLLWVRGTRGPFTGLTHAIEWPLGYEVARAGEGLAVLRNGAIFARVGQMVVVGGSLEPGGTFAACGLRALTGGRAR